MGEVVRLNCLTTLDLNPDDVLTGNVGKLSEVLILGFDKEGEFLVASSNGDLERLCFLAQKFIHKVHSGDYE